MTTPVSDGFAEAEAAWALACAESAPSAPEDVIDSDDEDDWGGSRLKTRLNDARARTVVLPTGDIHVCDSTCPFAEEDKDGNMVCAHTGIVVCRACAERTDRSTGRSTWSSDPDMQSGSSGSGYGGGSVRFGLGCSRCVNSGHQTVYNTKLVVQYLSYWCQTVSGA